MNNSNSFPLRPLAVSLAAAMLLSACVSPTPRTDPRAPVYERGSKVSGWVEGVLGSGQTAGVEQPEVSSGEAVYQAETIDATPATSPTQAPAAEKIASVDTTTSRPSVTVPAPVTSSSRPMGSAAKTLLAKAEGEQASGNLTAAASTLERALRIENHPLLWNRLASVRLRQKRYSLASDLAAKSNAIAGSDRALKRNNYLVIAEAKSALGEAAAASTARARANAL